jgi:hypothetical protein
LAADNLGEEIELYPSIESRLNRNNQICFVLACAVVLFILVNFGLSAAVVLAPAYSLGTKSATGIVSSTLLLLPRAISWLGSTLASAKKRGGAIYLFSKVPKQPNRIDSNFRFKEGVYKKPGVLAEMSTRVVQAIDVSDAAAPAETA